PGPGRALVDDGRDRHHRLGRRLRRRRGAVPGLLPRPERAGARALARRLAAAPGAVKAALATLLVAAAALLAPAAQGFANTEPLPAKQWYLTADHAWDYWPTMPQLAPVKVAVIDSGIDYGHPDFAGRIAAGRSFVRGSSWKEDTDGHGTFVAG